MLKEVLSRVSATVMEYVQFHFKRSKLTQDIEPETLFIQSVLVKNLASDSEISVSLETIVIPHIINDLLDRSPRNTKLYASLVDSLSQRDLLRSPYFRNFVIHLSLLNYSMGQWDAFEQLLGGLEWAALLRQQVSKYSSSKMHLQLAFLAIYYLYLMRVRPGVILESRDSKKLPQQTQILKELVKERCSETNLVWLQAFDLLGLLIALAKHQPPDPEMKSFMEAKVQANSQRYFVKKFALLRRELDASLRSGRKTAEKAARAPRAISASDGSPKGGLNRHLLILGNRDFRLKGGGGGSFLGGGKSFGGGEANAFKKFPLDLRNVLIPRPTEGANEQVFFFKSRKQTTSPNQTSTSGADRSVTVPLETLENLNVPLTINPPEVSHDDSSSLQEDTDPPNLSSLPSEPINPKTPPIRRLSTPSVTSRSQNNDASRSLLANPQSLVIDLPNLLSQPSETPKAPPPLLRPRPALFTGEFIDLGAGDFLLRAAGGLQKAARLEREQQGILALNGFTRLALFPAKESLLRQLLRLLPDPLPGPEPPRFAFLRTKLMARPFRQRDGFALFVCEIDPDCLVDPVPGGPDRVDSKRPGPWGPVRIESSRAYPPKPDYIDPTQSNTSLPELRASIFIYEMNNRKLEHLPPLRIDSANRLTIARGLIDRGLSCRFRVFDYLSSKTFSPFLQRLDPLRSAGVSRPCREATFESLGAEEPLACKPHSRVFVERNRIAKIQCMTDTKLLQKNLVRLFFFGPVGKDAFSYLKISEAAEIQRVFTGLLVPRGPSIGQLELGVFRRPGHFGKRLRPRSDVSTIVDPSSTIRYSSLLARHQVTLVDIAFSKETLFTHHRIEGQVVFVTAEFYRPKTGFDSLKCFVVLTVAERLRSFSDKKIVFTEDDAQNWLSFDMRRGSIDSKISCTNLLSLILPKLVKFPSNLYSKLALKKSDELSTINLSFSNEFFNMIPGDSRRAHQLLSPTIHKSKVIGRKILRFRGKFYVVSVSRLEDISKVSLVFYECFFKKTFIIYVSFHNLEAILHLKSNSPELAPAIFERLEIDLQSRVILGNFSFSPKIVLHSKYEFEPEENSALYVESFLIVDSINRNSSLIFDVSRLEKYYVYTRINFHDNLMRTINDRISLHRLHAMFASKLGKTDEKVLNIAVLKTYGRQLNLEAIDFYFSKYRVRRNLHNKFFADFEAEKLAEIAAVDSEERARPRPVTQGSWELEGYNLILKKVVSRDKILLVLHSQTEKLFKVNLFSVSQKSLTTKVFCVEQLEQYMPLFGSFMQNFHENLETIRLVFPRIIMKLFK